VVAAMAFLGTSAGCLSLSSSNYWLAVSPDGAFAAYLHGEEAGIGLGGEGTVLGGRGFVRWRRLDSVFGWVRSIKVVSYTGASPTGYITGMSPSIKFSSDSRHLGILTRGILSCIDLKTARMWVVAPPDERVTTFAWIGPDEMGYVGSPKNRVFFRHNINNPPEARRVILKNAGPTVQGASFPFEYWSPRGRFVFYKKHSRAFALLEVDTRAVRSFDTPPAVGMQVAWRSDESAALCVSYNEDHSPTAAMLIGLRTGETVDVSERYVAAFADAHTSELEPAWTPDGKDFIVNTWNRGGFLVQPRPWKIIPIGERLAPYLGGHYEPYTYGGDPRPEPPWVHSFPIAGWVKVTAGGKEYAVDYAVQRFVLLQRSYDSQVVAIAGSSPTELRIVELPLIFGGIKVRSIDLADARPLQPQAASNHR